MTAHKYVYWGFNGFETRDSILVTYNASNNLVELIDAIEEQTVNCVYQEAQGDEDPTSVGKLTTFVTKLYPNPVNGALHLDIDLSDYDVVLYSTSGALLGHFNNIKSLDFTNRTVGAYIINVIDNITGYAIAKSIIKN